MKSIRHRIIRASIRRPNPLHIQLVLAARDKTKSTTEEALIDNFCTRPGLLRMDH